MKIRILISLVLMSILIAGCDSTDVEKISSVTVYGMSPEPYELELSHSVIIPITKSSAIFIMEECYEDYSISLGEPELIDENWVFFWSPEYPDFEIKVNRNNGDVSISEFG
ncbi:MAG: hypothetical protein P9M09_04855 [Candidatus Celaenobacter antarcticus]|nr:hypothetical protein [Candidatus Celaenobacter antarcticus]